MYMDSEIDKEYLSLSRVKVPTKVHITFMPRVETHHFLYLIWSLLLGDRLCHEEDETMVSQQWWHTRDFRVSRSSPNRPRRK